MTANRAVDPPLDARRPPIDEQNPWPGLAAFDEASQRFFKGRHRETAELRRLVLNSPLTVVFGASGLGKTSLLQAGLFPALRQSHVLPVYLRLDVHDRTAPLIDQAKHALLTQLDSQNADAPLFREAESLWEWLHREQLELWSPRNHLLTPLFVFDQFEEVFTLGAENREAVTRLRIDLADLIENRLPAETAARVRGSDRAEADLSLSSQRYKVLLSFREDFLPAVEGWKRDLPSIMSNRLRLLPMSQEQGLEAVHTSAPHLTDEATAREIVRFVAAGQKEGASGMPELSDDDDELTVEPALLSLVCHGLNERRKAQRKTTIDLALLHGTGHRVVSDYYYHAVNDLPEHVQRFIENELITERGFRKPYDVDDARVVHGISDEHLRLLVDRRLVRIEPHRRTERVELTHDLLTRVVREHRDSQRAKAKARRLQKRWALASGLLVILVAAGVFRVVNKEREAERRIAEAVQSEQQQSDNQRLLVHTIAQLDSLVGQQPADDEATRAAQQAIAEAQRSIGAAPAGVITNRVTLLVRQMNDTDRDVRRAAVASLERDVAVHPVAIGLVLNTLDEENIGSLSDAGRINALYFLNATKLTAWSDEHRRLGLAAIQRILDRDARRVAAAGPQTKGELRKLREKLEG